MVPSDGGTTNPTLLRRAADWRDLPAWGEMFRRYDPLLREWCRAVLADESEVAEVSQRVWIELAERMTAFRYDSTRSFRGWLYSLCRSRVIDFLRHRNRERSKLSTAGVDWNEVMARVSVPTGDDSIEPEKERAFIARESEQAQSAVRARVESRTWNIYWRIAIEECSIKETADEYGMSYAATFAAFSRVERKLREEGERRLADLKREIRRST